MSPPFDFNGAGALFSEACHLLAFLCLLPITIYIIQYSLYRVSVPHLLSCLYCINNEYSEVDIALFSRFRTASE